MKKNSLLMMTVLLMAACGGEPQEKRNNSPKSLNLNLMFPSTLSDSRILSLKEDVETYVFVFSGNFTAIRKEIDRNMFSQYVFDQIPYDSQLIIQVKAISSAGLDLCSGEVSLNYGKESNGQTFNIEMSCS